MTQAMTTKVPFNKATVSKCMCPNCPVQSASKCVSGKTGGLNTALTKAPLNPQDIPGVYCSSGTAACRDLDRSERCICDSCAVYSQYELGGQQPGSYYCQNGPTE